jgi:predicted ATPase/class 3 adenylate cyclase
MSDRPTGTVTFLFTDIVGSTRLWEDHADSMGRALARHDAILRDIVEAHGGVVFKTTGDGAYAAFAAASAAVGAAVAAQRALTIEGWPPDAVIAARMAVHTGVAEARDGDYFGPTLNRTARLMAIGHGGQILVSSATTAVLGDEFERRDLGEHRLRDLSRPERVAQVVADGLARDHPPLRSLDALPTNLPVQLTSFVGREQELARITKAVGEHRLVTLTGVGGVGKTRLALQAAADAIGQFPDGVWLSELAAAFDAAAMASVVAAAFSIEPRTGMTLEDSVVDGLGAKQLLWVLDNCEHLIDPAARLADRVLRAAPGIKILATSREGLDLDGEHIIPLRSLRTSDAAVLDAIAESDAVRLFVDRAVAVRPEFALDASNAVTVNELCRRLDGIPLAIELASSRVASLGVDETLRLLDERFRLLTGGRRVALERHQTLRATVDWSYSLLTDTERVVFDRLGVFAGSFDARAGRAVVADETMDEWDVLDALDGLVRKSMITSDDSSGGVRFQLLETMRQYARERLDASATTDAMRRRHLDHYVVVTREIHDGLMTADELASRAQLSAELDNIRAASLWALDVGDVHSIVEVVKALDEERWVGNAPIGDVANRALPLIDALSPEDQQELMVAVIVERYRGDQTGFAEMLEHAFALQPDARRWSYRVLRMMAMPGYASPEQMQRLIDAIDLWRPDADSTTFTGRDATERAGNLQSVALAAVQTGDLELARGLAERAHEYARRGGSPSAMARTSQQLGMALASVDPVRARGLFEEGITFGRQGVRFTGFGSSLMQRALIDAQHGDVESAAALLVEAIQVLRTTGRHTELDGACGYAVEVLEASGSTDAALVVIGSILSGELEVLQRIPMPPSRTPPDVRAMRDQVGKDRFAELLDRGARMSYDEILDHIVASLEQIS